MKSFLFFPVLSFCVLSFSALAGTSTYGPCSFECQSIPDDAQVLRNFGQGTKTQLNSNHLKILSWNLYKGRMQDFTPVFAQLSQGKDLVLLSEATTDAPVATAMENVKDFGWIFSVSFEMTNQVGTGTAIGSYAEARNAHFYRTTDVEPFVKSPKTITVAEYAWPGSSETLLVLSIHGINWSGDEALDRQLRMVLPELQQHKGPVLFAGDFNIKNPNRLVVAQKVLAEAGLTRVTWDNPNTSKQLDDAFTRGVAVQRAHLINDYINKASDHPAIELEVELPIN
jgi:endonuclease/exonuclease/phosphatase (EEP) superfamily protein YafD